MILHRFLFLEVFLDEILNKILKAIALVVYGYDIDVA